MPHNLPVQKSQSVTPAGEVELNRGEVVQQPGLSDVWQAEITVPQGGVNHTGRQRVFTIRGPPRKSREQADSDAKRLTEAAVDGPKAARSLANSMHRS